ncbi:MAG: twin-arginine translocation signal domain-containing protein [Phycisphaerales bacterium]|nr:twin-arginine translocation signal domain-containing protein [Phycisphaerales bacterium]
MTNRKASRRNFLKGTALASGAALLNPSPLWGIAPQGERIKVGLVGCGGRGTGAAVQALAADKGVVIWAMADAFQDRLDSSLANLLKSDDQDRVDVAADRRFVGIDAIDKLLPLVDVVLLCSTPSFRPAQLAKAVAAGKHIFCEKPVCVDSVGYRSVIESVKIARAKNLTLVSGFCWRSSSPERAIVGEILGGRLGVVVGVTSTYLTSPLGTRPREAGWSDFDFQLRNWQHFNWLSGDHLVEQAVHSVDKINWVMGGRHPTKCTGLGSRFCREDKPEFGDIYDNFTVVYEYENGPRATMIARQQPNCYNDNTDWITGTKGYAWINGWAPTHWIKDYDGKTLWSYPKDGEAPNMYQVEHDTLFKSIRDGRSINEGEFMADSCLMAIMGRMSAYSGRQVTWEEATTGNENLTPPSLSDPMPVGDAPRPGSTTSGAAKS